MDPRLIVLAVGMFALGTDSYVMAGVLPQIAASYGVSIGAAGQLTTVYAVTFALLSPTIAALAAGVPRKHMLLSGISLFVLANLATALAPTFTLALLTRVIAGVGAAMFSPTATGSAAMIVAPERRGFALSVVMAGFSAATALGSPIGAIVGGVGDWRWTMALVSVLGSLSGLGIWAFLADIPLPPKVTLRQRLAPLADARAGLLLLTTLIAMCGTFTVYNYFAVVFDRAIAGSAYLLGGLLAAWGIAGTAANLTAGRLIDRTDARKVVRVLLIALVLAVGTLPFSSAHLWSAAIAVTVWGGLCWGILVPQQHRLVSLAPSIAPILLGLNTAGTYLGVTTAGVIGAAGINAVGAHALGFLGAALIVVALVFSELAARRATATLRSAPHLSV